MRDKDKLILIFDEAKKVYAGVSATSVRGELTSMGREFGIGIVAADQMPHVLGDAIKDNVFTTVCLSQSSRKNINEMAAMLGLNEDQKAFLNNLPVGRAIVKLMDRHTSPFLVKILPSNIEKNVTTKELLALTKPLIDQLQYEPRVNLFEDEISVGAETGEAPVGLVIPGRASARPPNLKESEFDYLMNLKNHPHLSVTEAHDSLQMTRYKGNKVKKSLVKKAYVEEVSIRLGSRHRPKTYLKLTGKAIAVVGEQKFARGKGGFEHQLLSHLLKIELEKKGYEPEIECFQNGKAADMGIEREDRSIAIEIAMSVNGEIENIRKDLEAGFDEVISVAADEKIKEKLCELVSSDEFCIENREKIRITVISDVLSYF